MQGAAASRIGNVQVAQGNLPAALDAYRGSLAIFERLATSAPNNASWQRDLAVSVKATARLQRCARAKASAMPRAPTFRLPAISS